jgi:hypothetical protein
MQDSVDSDRLPFQGIRHSKRGTSKQSGHDNRELPMPCPSGERSRASLRLRRGERRFLRTPRRSTARHAHGCLRGHCPPCGLRDFRHGPPPLALTASKSTRLPASASARPSATARKCQNSDSTQRASCARLKWLAIPVSGLCELLELMDQLRFHTKRQDGRRPIEHFKNTVYVVFICVHAQSSTPTLTLATQPIASRRLTEPSLSRPAIEDAAFPALESDERVGVLGRGCSASLD